MNSSAQISDSPYDRLHRSNHPSKWRMYAFAIAIIVGIGGLVAGAISNLNQVQASMMMAAGSAATIFFISCVIYALKDNCTSNQNLVNSIDTCGGLIFGKDAWNIWNVEVVDDVPEPPPIEWDELDPFFKEAYRLNYVLLYIPESIEVNGIPKILTLETFKEITGNRFAVSIANFESHIVNVPPSGWMLISKSMIPRSRNKNYTKQREMLMEKTYNIPHALEVVALTLMAKTFIGEPIFSDGKNPQLTCIRCDEWAENFNRSVIVRGFKAQLDVESRNKSASEEVGVAAVCRFQSELPEMPNPNPFPSAIGQEGVTRFDILQYRKPTIDWESLEDI